MNTFLRFTLITLPLCTLTACDGSSGNVDPTDVFCEDNAVFVDATNGDDNNPSNNACEPWQSLAFTFSNISSGDTVKLKRGETWYEGIVVENSNIVIDAYGSGNAPTLDGRQVVSTWSSIGSDIYQANISLNSDQGLGNLSDGTEMMRFVEWNSDATSTLSPAPFNSFTYSGDMIFVKYESDPSDASLLASVNYRAVYVDTISDIAVRNISVEGFSLHGIEFKNCDNCSAENITIREIGGALISEAGSSPVYAGNGIEFTNNSSNGLVENATITSIFDSCLSPQTYTSSQTLTNIEFQNSVLSECGFAGVEISLLSNGGSSGSQISNIVMDNLTISGTGKGWSGQRFGTEGYGVRIQADNGAGSIDQVSISNINVSDSYNSGIRITGDTGTTTIEKSRIEENDAFGIDVSSASNSSTQLLLTTSVVANNDNYGINYNCPSCLGLTIYHNTFYNNSLINLAIFAQSNEALIQNNIFASSNAMTHVFSSSELQGLTLDHNCYTEAVNMIGYDSEAYSSLSAFLAAEMLEQNGQATSGVNFADPENNDFSLLASSDCIGVGDTSLNIDNDILNFPYATPPSAGAFAF